MSRPIFPSKVQLSSMVRSARELQHPSRPRSSLGPNVRSLRLNFVTDRGSDVSATPAVELFTGTENASELSLVALQKASASSWPSGRHPFAQVSQILPASDPGVP
eukprot:scaffold109480_cov43-Prasinocladus_malaysianus.AAC.1